MSFWTNAIVAAKKAAGEEIFHEDLLKLTGKKKVSENAYILKAAGVLDDVTKLGQEGRGPVQKRVQKRHQKKFQKKVEELV